jgi:hypothetical protein
MKPPLVTYRRYYQKSIVHDKRKLKSTDIGIFFINAQAIFCGIKVVIIYLAEDHSGRGNYMQLQTVMVIEYTGGGIHSVRSFSEDKEGNKQAEELFVKVAKDNGMDDIDIDACLADGLFEEGDYQIFLVHSQA